MTPEQAKKLKIGQRVMYKGGTIHKLLAGYYIVRNVNLFSRYFVDLQTNESAGQEPGTVYSVPPESIEELPADDRIAIALTRREWSLASYATGFALKEIDLNDESRKSMGVINVAFRYIADKGDLA